MSLADSYVYEETLAPLGPRFEVKFRRLGSQAEPATVRFTTRDITTTAGVDYVPQSGTLHFAATEAEKSITIPVIADDDVAGEEAFEVVVTGAEGIEALPAPHLLWIQGPGPVTPTVRRMKRLSDNRVLVEAWGRSQVNDNGLNKNWTMEHSPDLRAWGPLLHEPAQYIPAQMIWLDPAATNTPTRYYRAVVP